MRAGSRQLSDHVRAKAQAAQTPARVHQSASSCSDNKFKKKHFKSGGYCAVRFERWRTVSCHVVTRHLPFSDLVGYNL